MIPDPYRSDHLHDQVFVKIFTAKRVTIGAEWNSRDVCSGYWRLYVNDRDGAGVQWAGGYYPLPARRVHFIPAWVRFTCVNRRPLEHFYIHFDLIGLTGVTVQRLFQKPLSVAPIPPPAPDNIFRVKAFVYTALGELLATVPARQWLEWQTAHSPVAPAIRHIEDHLGELITNAQLAALCHFSEDHFTRLFRLRVGRTPAQYILERRIAAATHRLAFTSDSIEQIAERLAFANRFHFTRMFTQRMGVSPAAYRKRARV
jgi:AraC-like DNA-binding protein